MPQPFPEFFTLSSIVLSSVHVLYVWHMWKPITNLKKEFILNIFFKFLYPVWGFPSGSVVENLPPKQETWVQSLGQEDPLEKEMATH